MSLSGAFSRLGDNVIVSASITSAEAVLPGGGLFVRNEVCRVYNESNFLAFVRLRRASGGAATAADLAVPAGADQMISLVPGTTHAQVVLLSGSGNVHFQRGAVT